MPSEHRPLRCRLFGHRMKPWPGTVLWAEGEPAWGAVGVTVSTRRCAHCGEEQHFIDIPAGAYCLPVPTKPPTLYGP